jgi:hypothetical protein
MQEDTGVRQVVIVMIQLHHALQLQQLQHAEIIFVMCQEKLWQAVHQIVVQQDPVQQKPITIVQQ